MIGYLPTYKEITEKIGTPAYVFDIDIIKCRLAFIKKILGRDIKICYAMKANPFVVGHIDEYVDKYEVCSPGEFRICKRAGADIEKIVLSGVYKEAEDIKKIVKKYGDKILYTAESENQFNLINQAACENGIKVKVILRVTTGNQFGMDEEIICRIIEQREIYKSVNILGLQHFSGTQRHNLKIYKEELDYCDTLLKKLESKYGYKAEKLEFGAGFFFDYFQPRTEKEREKKKEAMKDEELLTEFAKLLSQMKFKGEITLEIGRFISASCGKYYTKVVDEKVNCGKRFCIADGGIHQMNYFGQMMAMKLPYYRQLKKNGNVFISGSDVINLCGSLCTINDNIVKDMPVDSPEKGDIFEFHNTGAYSMTETPALFLSRDIPKVYLYSRETGLDLVRKSFDTDKLNHEYDRLL